MKKVFVINGVNSGKDTFVEFIKIAAKNTKYDVFNYSSIDPIRRAAMIYLGYDGEKDIKSRKFLFELKKLSIEYNDYPYNYIKRKIDSAKENDILFLHIREQNEIKKIKNTFNFIKTILIDNDSKKSYGNIADDNVNDIEYSYVVDNTRTIDDLENIAKEFFKFITE